MNHLSYTISVKLAKFFGKDSLEPLVPGYYSFRDNYLTVQEDGSFPAYTLEDLLSRPFCEAMAKKIKGYWPGGLHATLADKFYDGGFPAVEKEILRLIEEK